MLQLKELCGRGVGERGPVWCERTLEQLAVAAAVDDLVAQPEFGPSESPPPVSNREMSVPKTRSPTDSSPGEGLSEQFRRGKRHYEAWIPRVDKDSCKMAQPDSQPD